MKYWYALIIMICLLIITSFVFSAEPYKLTSNNADYLLKNGLLDYNRSEIVRETNFITKKDWCNETISSKEFVFTLGFDCTKIDNKIVEKRFKLLENQKLNEYATAKLKQNELQNAKAKNTKVVISTPTKIVIASSIDEKGQIIGLDPKATVKDSCWFELLGFCIWK